jgi:hypothetical protein
MNDSNGKVSFACDILPLFSRSDIEHMNRFGVRLGHHAWMADAANAHNVFRYLTGQSQPRMPLGGPYWSEEQIELFSRWMEGGYQP